MPQHVPLPAAEVVVVGAGPVGLTAGALLAARGVRVAVVERHPTTSDTPKAISLDDESLRVFGSAGCAPDVARVVVPGVGTRYLDAAGTPVFQARSPWPFRFGHPFKNPFAQPDLERALLHHLRAAPTATVLMRTEVQDLTHDPRGVTVHLGDRSTIRAEWVLGCDGGRSTVRTLLGIGTTGRSHPQPWLVADLLGDQHDQRYGLHGADPRRPYVIVPGRDGRCRYEFLLHDGEGTPEAAPDFALVARLVAPFRDLTPEQVERAVIYRFHGVVADRWQAGRAFLLGDAAHMMPPFAGQGLNSGVRDAANLCWKIADVLAGRIDVAALASYEAERRPHAEATVRISERLGRTVMTTDRRWAARRDAWFARRLRDPAVRAWFEEMRYRPAQVYREGMVAGGPGAGTMIGQPRALDTRSARIALLDELVPPGWRLFGIGVPDAEVTAAATRLGHLAVATARIAAPDRLPGGDGLVDVDGGLDREFADHVGRLVLVRPDHVVAASWVPGHPPLFDALHLSAPVTAVA